jgi:hypothetical protein
MCGWVERVESEQKRARPCIVSLSSPCMGLMTCAFAHAVSIFEQRCAWLFASALLQTNGH